MRSKLKTKVVSVVMGEGGEVLSEVTSSRVSIDKSDYMMMFDSGISALTGLGLSEIGVLCYLLRSLSFNKNMIVLNRRFKKKIASEVGVSEYTLPNVIRRMVKSGVIFKAGIERDGIYYVNPEYFWRGSFMMRRDAIKEMLMNRGAVE